MPISTRLRAWRTQSGKTQEEAARLLDISRSAYALIETGRLRPTRRVADRLRAVFGEESDALLRPILARSLPTVATPTDSPQP
jgi:transcriptional regulator with XRE-family HTH domain